VAAKKGRSAPEAGQAGVVGHVLAAEEEEEEDLLVFNDTIEGPRAPAVMQGRTEVRLGARPALPHRANRKSPSCDPSRVQQRTLHRVGSTMCDEKHTSRLGLF
jgi:hypothetical protein